MSASLVAALVSICGVWFGVGILVGFALCRWRIRRATRRIDALDSGSQLEVTGVHRVDREAKTPVERPRAKPEEDGQR